ncbi:hypothetical protein MACH10_21200 [Thalassospira tepidiphila]|nr:hypothetical protein MACH10_21200 [Thalassospira tepidiphila]
MAIGGKTCRGTHSGDPAACNQNIGFDHDCLSHSLAGYGGTHLCGYDRQIVVGNVPCWVTIRNDFAIRFDPDYGKAILVGDDKAGAGIAP